jgi:hypothetical protein
MFMFCRSLFVFSDVRVTRSLVLCVMFCRSLFVFSGVRVTGSHKHITKDRVTRTLLKTNNDLQNINI